MTVTKTNALLSLPNTLYFVYHLLPMISAFTGSSQDADVAASQRKLIVPRYCLNSFGRRCFAVAGPSTWNSLPDSLRDPALSLNIFRRQLKTHFFAKY